MPIESICAGCGRTLRVGDEHAGAEAQCPICSTVYRVPMPAPQRVPPAVPEPSAPSGSAAESMLFFARIPTGAEFGPVPASTVLQWSSEGRLNASCFVRAQQSSSWIPYNEWVQSQSHFAISSAYPAAGSNAFGTIPATSEQSVAYPRSSRGALVLILGIVSWLLCITWIGTVPVSMTAIIIGRSDLQRIGRGETSPKERTLTLIGLWLAGLALALNLLALALMIASALFGL